MVDYEKLKEAVVSFSSIAGDAQGSDAFQQYVTGFNGLAWKFPDAMPNTKYGDGMALILAFFSIAGEHKWFTMPADYKLGPYSAKQKGMGFAVPIDETRLALLVGTDSQRNGLFIEILEALEAAVTKRKFKPEIVFHKELFLTDLRGVIDSLA